MPFDKKKYDIEYRKNHKKRFGADLNLEEYKEIETLLNNNNLTKVGFIRLAIKNLKNGTLKKEENDD